MSTARPSLAAVRCSISGQNVTKLPHACGIYRFYDQREHLLYVGKSIDLLTRVRAHYTNARMHSRQQRMLDQVSWIDCQPTAGEIGALLQENAAIKREMPLYNRRQRRVRRLWTIALQTADDGFARPLAVDFLPGGAREQDVYGLYPSRHAVQDKLRELARPAGLCPRILGLERGQGPCFQHQLGRCRGACIGRDPAAEHNARLLAALVAQHIAPWPLRTALLLREQAASDAHTSQPQLQFHLVNHWAYLGSFTSAAAAQRGTAADATFDRDAYRILRQACRRPDITLLCATDAQALPAASANLLR